MAPLAEPQDAALQMTTRQAIFAGVLGNTLEWYDFALYGHLSVYLGRTFFPEEDSSLQVLVTFAVFSVSFFMRPLGALLFSAIGDRFGRRRALSISMMGMAIPTAAIGLLPGYAAIGGFAAVLLIVLRLFQGLALGGEMGGAVTYVMEHTPSRKIGIASSLIQSSTCMGLLLGTLIASGLSFLLDETAFAEWGWRIPFLLGLVGGWIGLRIRQKMPESALYEEAKAHNRLLGNPVRHTLHHHKREILTGILLLGPMTCGFFFAFVYFNSYMISALKFTALHALLVTSGGLVTSLAVTLVGGGLTDRLGFKRILSIGAGLLLVATLPLAMSLSGRFGSTLILPAFFGFSALLGLYTSAAFAGVTSLFRTEVRYSGVSLAVNVASPILGSTAPLLMAWLVRNQGADAGFTIFGIYLCALFCLAGTAIAKLDRWAFRGWGPQKS